MTVIILINLVNQSLYGEFIEDVLKELSDDTLLGKCYHGMTPNNSEALNQIIWKRCPEKMSGRDVRKRCPEDTFVSRSTLQFRVCYAAINFNDG